MEINNELLSRLGTLCKLEFDGKDREAIRRDLQQIVAFVEKLQDIDTAGVEPLIHMSEEKNVLRADEVQQHISHADAMRNAPDKDSDYFKTPKVPAGN